MLTFQLLLHLPPAIGDFIDSFSSIKPECCNLYSSITCSMFSLLIKTKPPSLYNSSRKASVRSDQQSAYVRSIKVINYQRVHLAFYLSQRSFPLSLFQGFLLFLRLYSSSSNRFYIIRWLDYFWLRRSLFFDSSGIAVLRTGISFASSLATESIGMKSFDFFDYPVSLFQQKIFFLCSFSLKGLFQRQ